MKKWALLLFAITPTLWAFQLGATKAAAEALRKKHDEIKADPTRSAPLHPGAVEAMYRATHQSIVDLVKGARRLFDGAALERSMP